MKYVRMKDVQTVEELCCIANSFQEHHFMKENKYFRYMLFVCRISHSQVSPRSNSLQDAAHLTVRSAGEAQQNSNKEVEMARRKILIHEGLELTCSCEISILQSFPPLERLGEVE